MLEHYAKLFTHRDDDNIDNYMWMMLYWPLYDKHILFARQCSSIIQPGTIYPYLYLYYIYI